MLSKCANPRCSNIFRYLHEGRLYLINSTSRVDGRKLSSTRAGKSGSPEYAWLCSACSSCMTIHLDEENGTIMVRMSETLSSVDSLDQRCRGAK
jgi:hypothetical protein